MGIQNWANFFGGSILLVFVLFLLSISTIDGTKSCCPWCDEANCEEKCSLQNQKWTLKCNNERTICYDALTEPDIETKSKPTSRFKAINANNIVPKKEAVFCTVDLPKGMNTSDYISQYKDGYFLHDLSAALEEVKDCRPCDYSDWENACPEELVDVCNSTIYCSGRMLQAMNYHLFYDQDLFKKDSKFFVDSPLKYDVNEVLAKFENEFPVNVPIKDMNPNKLKEFYKNNFNPPDDTSVALKNCDDIGNGNPTKLEAIKDEKMKKWALELHAIWKPLCKRIDPSTANSTNRHSLIPVTHPFIVPGGRFREYYYWDSLWTIKGLLASGYDDMAKNMIENFIELVENEKFGFIPNGGRVYYEMRSQPPLLIPMAYEYYKKLKSLPPGPNGVNIAAQFMEKHIHSLVKELKFWETNRKVNVTKNGKVYEMFQYKTKSRVPRPESFCADVLTAIALKNASKNNELSAKQAGDLFQNLASAAESGWDFSSRWVKNPDEFKLSEIITTQIVPVDLNAYICGNYRILHEIFKDLEGNDDADTLYYGEKYNELVAKFKDVFLLDNDKQTGWYDYNIGTNKHNERFYASMAVPLYTKCYDISDHNLLERVYKTFENYGVLNQTLYHGIPTTLKETDQQWDLPNIWPPMVHMMIEGFHQSGNKEMEEKANEMATKYVLATYKLYEMHCNNPMYEKLTVKGEPGGGGEYDVQTGFGWTNGAILDLLTKYDIKWTGEELPKCKGPEKTSKSWSFHKHLKTMG